MTEALALDDLPVLAPWVALVAELRARDSDPAYADAPVLDVYGRISINPETGESEKVDRQLVDCLEQVRRRHARLGEVLRDDGKSAWKRRAKRPGWDRLLVRLETRQAAGVVCWHTDRLVRQPRDLERLIDLGEKGLLIVSCFGKYDLADSHDRLTVRVITATKAEECDSTSRRQQRKAAAIREAGRLHGGFRRFGRPGVLPSGEPASAELVLAEREAITWGARAHLDGVPMAAIAKEWNRRELLTPFGNTWAANSVAGVLKNPHIAGLIRHEGVVVGRVAGEEPMVSREDFEALTATFQARRRGRPVTEVYLLSGGHLICSKCRGRMTGHLLRRRGTNRPPRREYNCKTCKGTLIGADRVEAEVRLMVIRVLSDPKHARQMARQSKKLAEAQARLATAEQTAQELSRRLGEGRMTLDNYDAAMAPLAARLDKLRAEVEALRDSGAGEAARQVNAEEVAAEWDAADVEHRRALVRRAAPRGIVVLPISGPHGYSHQAPVSERLEVL